MKEKAKLGALKTAGEPAQPHKRRITGKANPAALFGGMTTKNQNTGTDAKAKAKAKAKSKSPKNAKAKSTSSQATKSKSTTPPGVRPALDMENTVYYGGGKLYSYPKRKLVTSNLTIRLKLFGVSKYLEILGYKL